MNAMIYPSLPATHDFGLIRIGGAGIGNCFYAYFHAVVIAEEINGRIISPTWSSVKLGPLLRREFSLRRYGMMFRPHPDEIRGLMKAVRLISLWPKRNHVEIRNGEHTSAPTKGKLTVVGAPLTVVDAPPGEFTFAGLHPHRDMIRRRLLEILAEPPLQTPKWGQGDYMAAHIRLGDFVSAHPNQVKSGKQEDLRIPISWYANAIRRVSAIFPELPVYIFSDGREHELADILAIDRVSLRREPSDIADLLSLAQARLLIGSNSTFSRWAAFLGDMPSIWLKTEQPAEQPTGELTPILYIGDDFEVISREGITA
jgi:Glycosyl transferase family 11